MSITVIPAIDIIGGSAVRLTRGDYGKRKTYSDNPVEVAVKFAEAGASRLHLVDLDGAKSSSPANAGVLRQIVRGTGLKVEWGGGVRSAETAEKLLEAGADSVICGSIAINAPELFSSMLKRFGPDRIVLGADVRNGKVAVGGWLEESDADVQTLIGRFTGDGLSRVICTDISRDGTLSGPGWPLYSALVSMFPGLHITVSGGVSSADDIRLAEEAGADGIIIGKALYEGKIKLEDLKEWWQNG